MIKSFRVWFVFLTILLCNICIANDARFSGMGYLSLIFQDDFYRLDLYDFGGIPAGFLKNDTSSSVVLRASGLRQSWERDSLIYLAIGQAIPQRLIDYAPVEAVSFYELIPQFKLVPCEFIYASRRIEEAYDDWGNLLRPQAYGVYAGYSQLTHEFVDAGESDIVRTPSLSIIYSKAISHYIDFGLSSDGFYGLFNSADRQDKVTFLPLGGGLGVSYNRESVSFGVNAEYHYPMFDYTHTMSSGGKYSEDFSGHALSPSLGSLIRFANITWAGVFDYKWVSLSGSTGDADMGDLMINGYAAKTQLLYVPSFIRFTGFVQYDYKKPKYTTASDNIWFETAYTNMVLGGGAGVTLRQIEAGIEGLYNYFRADDEIIEEAFRSSSILIKCGAELHLIENFFIRGGYNYSQIDPDLDDIIDTGDRTTVNTITGGLGINFLRNTRIDIAYNYKWATTDLDPDERITDHIIFLYLKYAWIPEIY